MIEDMSNCLAAELLRLLLSATYLQAPNDIERATDIARKMVTVWNERKPRSDCLGTRRGFPGKEYGTIRNYQSLLHLRLITKLTESSPMLTNRQGDSVKTMFTSCTLLRTPFLSLRKSAARTLRDS